VSEEAVRIKTSFETRILCGNIYPAKFARISPKHVPRREEKFSHTEVSGFESM
jgi:hypothetical protein